MCCSSPGKLDAPVEPNGRSGRGSRIVFDNDAGLRVEARDAFRVARSRERSLAKRVPDPERPGTRSEVGRGGRAAENLTRPRLRVDRRDRLVVRVEHPDRSRPDRDARGRTAERNRRQELARLSSRAPQRPRLELWSLHLGPEQRRRQSGRRRAAAPLRRPPVRRSVAAPCCRIARWGPSSAGSWARIARSSSFSSGPGSRPSSLSSSCRPCWYVSRASVWRPER